jgi:glycosyltransferase involved in cell wall biosynthesis
MLNSILLTVYNRPVGVLSSVLRHLEANGLDDSEVVIVDDGSTIDYSPVAIHYEHLPITWLKKEQGPAYRINGSNNPAAAWNFAIEHSSGDNVVLLSSDCKIHKDTLRAIGENGGKFWQPAVSDWKTASVFLGRTRIYPMGWVAAMPRTVVEKINGFDEEYMNGMAFEDNDFTARVALETGQVVIDEMRWAVHISHPLTNYSDDRRGFKISEAYTRKKWGGIPWSWWEGAKDDPLRVEVTEGLGVIDLAVSRK